MVNKKKDKNKGCRIKEVVVCVTLNEKQEIIPTFCNGESTKADLDYKNSKNVFMLPDWQSSWLSKERGDDLTRVIQKDLALQKILEDSISQQKPRRAAIESEMAVDLEENQEEQQEQEEESNDDSESEEKDYYVWSPESDEEET